MNQPFYLWLFLLLRIAWFGGFVFVVWLVIAAIRRWMGVKRTVGFLAKPAPRANWLARATDVLLQRIVEHVETAFAENKNGPHKWRRQRFWRQVRDELTIPAAKRFALAVERHEMYQAKELLNRSFDDPVFAQLADSPSPQARLAFVSILTEQPTPRHREWLTKLTSDSDDKVRTAATQAIQDLQRQAAEPPPQRRLSPPAAKIGDITFDEPPLDLPSR